MRNVIFFQTNDPEAPEAMIEAVVSKVKGGVSTLPTSVVFGSVPLNSVASQTVDIYDPGLEERRVERVLSTTPDRFSVRLVPLERTEKVKTTNRGDGLPDTLIGRLEIVPLTERPGSLEGEVHIYVSDLHSGPEILPVLGRVLGTVEIAPSSFVLPRNSSAGPLYFAECLCWSTNGSPISLTTLDLPSDLFVRIVPVKSRQAYRGTVCTPAQAFRKVKWPRT